MIKKIETLTLDQRINRDLEERLKGNPISKAVELSKLHAFSTKGMPGYFTGNRDADTVFVHLNPGLDANEADERWDFETKYFSKKNFINDYIDSRRNYGKNDRMREDSFDFKQAAFLYDWENSGIDFPSNVDWNKIHSRSKAAINISWLDAKEHVLMDKLQLELVPYASSQFEINNNNDLSPLLPFVKTLLEEIFRPEKGRKYVIFGGRNFDDLFKLYNEKEKDTFVDLTDKINVFEINGFPMSDKDKRAEGFVKKDDTVLSSAFYFNVININYKEKQQKALIAYTYPKQNLSNAFSIMQAYGRFCYRAFINDLPIQNEVVGKQ